MSIFFLICHFFFVLHQSTQVDILSCLHIYRCKEKGRKEKRLIGLRCTQKRSVIRYLVPKTHPWEDISSPESAQVNVSSKKKKKEVRMNPPQTGRHNKRPFRHFGRLRLVKYLLIIVVFCSRKVFIKVERLGVDRGNAASGLVCGFNTHTLTRKTPRERSFS